MWGGTRQTLSTKVSPEFSDARADVIRTGVLIFRGRDVVNLTLRHHHEDDHQNSKPSILPPSEDGRPKPPPLE